MANFIINGGKKLKGTIKTNSAKNSAVAILCALPMIKGKTILTHMPRIEEVNRIIEILISIGLKINWTGQHTLQAVNHDKINLNHINKKSYEKTRSAILLIGSLSSVFKNFTLPKISGCKLGKRTVTPHIIALNHLGIKVKKINNLFHVSQNQTKGSSFTMYESGDTATENAILASVQLPGKTEINLASSNYMVQDLCYFLIKAGAKIKGVGTTKLQITGVKKLKHINYPIMPDPIESMAFISIAIATASKIKITGCPIEFLSLELEKLRVMGQTMNISRIYKSTNHRFDLVDIEIIPAKLNALPDKLYARPFPGLNIDNLPLFLPILTQARGQTLVHDWVYENRVVYYLELNKLGANVMLHNANQVTVTGPTKLKPAEIICPPALRPAINLLICMLGAKGKSILRHSYSIDRGYENICERLNKLGADIKKVD
ncbi:UDP-N-acetylglucosamine 1-carboxyvinyltransferase [Patescibacteria group bacterium]|nr:UDP-N-acetylglucosamine 1-carboxyvinyltransferase [Patescibacteria group bacterium]MBU1663100.1 UDP-N-acetylglucosamine 1-carboxyvinyltransferase [Patescibacteria group bacterium]MBU1934047.1 UDP-N-acetylglucosamine 1-carboxyvinyltransferase [Patescibacteria group bacterium]MBU2008029.1 UDP-N-acetylglucosamine 1-carboxyvinyltransferase [Patescibacteria group bacterium]MBU2233665.1 UDP-N-acetylglucosamine 1-carboxyvinyltransferase [Patescibacteria group bacterium]